ncbi:MAG: hypothetical protein ACOH1M_04055 [Rhodoglobus sp.]
MAADKKIDPRFDPAFQRGYAEGAQGAHADAVRAARTVDSLRDDAADVQYAPRVPTAAPSVNRAAVPAVTSGHTSGHAASPVDPRIAPGLEDQWGPTPQSHYVDDEGALAEITPVVRGKSLARNPWIYVLWAVGVLGLVFGSGIQVWTYAVYYRFGSPQLSGFDWTQAAIAIAPGLTQLGAICVGLAVFTHAIRWMRKNV